MHHRRKERCAAWYVRSRRICYPGAFFHCINRGNRRDQIYSDESDYGEMLQGLGEASQLFDVRIHAAIWPPFGSELLLLTKKMMLKNIFSRG